MTSSTCAWTTTCEPTSRCGRAPWPVVNWLLWRSLLHAGEAGRAERIRRAALDQIAEGGFAEYFEPFTGEPLGSNSQSWTAAVVLDWLLSDPLQKPHSKRSEYGGSSCERTPKEVAGDRAKRLGGLALARRHSEWKPTADDGRRGAGRDLESHHPPTGHRPERALRPRAPETRRNDG